MIVCFLLLVNRCSYFHLCEAFLCLHRHVTVLVRYIFCLPPNWNYYLDMKMAQGPPRIDGELPVKLDPGKIHQPPPPGVRGLSPMGMKVPTGLANNIRVGNLVVSMGDQGPARISPGISAGVTPTLSCGGGHRPPMMQQPQQGAIIARGGAADFKSNPPFKATPTSSETNNNNTMNSSSGSQIQLQSAKGAGSQSPGTTNMTNTTNDKVGAN